MSSLSYDLFERPLLYSLSNLIMSSSNSLFPECIYYGPGDEKPRPRKRTPSVANREKFEDVKYLIPLISEEFLSHADKTTRCTYDTTRLNCPSGNPLQIEFRKTIELLSPPLSSRVNRMRGQRTSFSRSNALATDQRVSHCLITRKYVHGSVLTEIKSHRPGSCSI
ncbi:hypothetical protein WUBG_02924 [Wuchereria bancrofti]|uniref:Uncharacterized protein n=1 Tax=Wuchereria bancrofti TaxID=6293 RepID=J9BFW4_WUCBA|nr:hypothetical protein WUBG_02924 [Wuchereria bancrofti]